MTLAGRVLDQNTPGWQTTRHHHHNLNVVHQFALDVDDDPGLRAFLLNALIVLVAAVVLTVAVAVLDRFGLTFTAILVLMVGFLLIGGWVSYRATGGGE